MRSVGKFTIRPATTADVPAVREMMREYMDWIALDLAFQEIEAELAGLPGEYAPPSGALFVATDGKRAGRDDRLAPAPREAQRAR